MTTGEALLRAVLANPACDTARLVYADAIEEAGNPVRAAYIREKVAEDSGDFREQQGICTTWEMMSGEPVNPDASHAPTLTDITGLLNADIRVDGYECRRWYWRGFVQRIELPLGPFLTHAKPIFRAHPVVSVRLMAVSPWPGGDRTWLWNTREGVDVGTIRRDGSARGPRTTSLLPREFRHFLKAYRNQKVTATGRRGWHRYTYATEANAWADLSRACVGYGRWLVGLPKLKEEVAA